MNQSLSIYLDLVRFSAALTVMLYHLGGQRWTGGLGWQFNAFGGPAIDVFFVLSGYVIAYTANEKERDLRSYAVSRIARIYSVAVPVLVLTAAMGLIGHVVRPAFDWGDTSISAYLISLAFVNQVWFALVEPGNNGPYWSLSYEVWYYVFFACTVFFTGKVRYGLTALALLAAGPRIILMLPIWLTGVASYYIVKRGKMPQVAVGLMLFLGSTAVLAGLIAWQLVLNRQYGHGATMEAAFQRPLWDPVEYAVDWGLGLLIGMNFVGFYYSASCWAAPMAMLRRPVRWLAGATFTLYLLHYPLAQFLIAASPWELGSAPQQAFVYGGTLVSVFVVAQYTERRKDIWRAAVQRLFPARL